MRVRTLCISRQVGSWPFLVILTLACRSAHEMEFGHLARRRVRHGLLGGRCLLVAVDCRLVQRLRQSQEAASQQIELGAAKHLPFDHLQTIDMPFHWSRTPGQRQASSDRVEIATETFRQSLKRAEGALSSLREPLLQALSRPTPQHLGEGLP
jgi:hypothetical protein